MQINIVTMLLHESSKTSGFIVYTDSIVRTATRFYNIIFYNLRTCVSFRRIRLHFGALSGTFRP